MNDLILSCPFVMLSIEQAWRRVFGLFPSATIYPHWCFNLPISNKFTQIREDVDREIDIRQEESGSPVDPVLEKWA
jgi:hypothetical protein